jgi:hypothetical protein
LSPEVLGQKIDQFLASRGIAVPDSGSPATGAGRLPDVSRPDRAAAFVCEEDVRQALRAGRKILLDSRTIVTPAARDLGEEKRVFVDTR